MSGVNIGEAYSLYRAELTGYIRKHFGNRELAEDAVQQAYSKAIFSLPHLAYMPPEAVRAWLYATARNAAIDAARKQSRVTNDYDFDLQAAPARDFVNNMALREGMAKLDHLKREIVGMRYIAGFTSKEIEAKTGIPASTVRYHLKTALRQLKGHMKEEETP